ncbi:MAG: hypothetical protein R2701_01865 [Acidimicrobiales bacterium]
MGVQLVLYPVSTGVWLQGFVAGLLNSLVVLGMFLVYRANRVVNFAQASIGTYPAALAIGLFLFGAPALGVSLGMGAVAALAMAGSAATLLGWRGRRVAVAAGLVFVGSVAGLWVSAHSGTGARCSPVWWWRPGSAS